MSNLLKCCCGQCDYWLLVKCSDPTQAIDPPRYVYARCDVYELQTGDAAINCPAGWAPDPYIVWIQDPDPCEFAPECGFFRCAADFGIAPTQITTPAVNQGLQTTPPLTVSDTCPGTLGGPVSLASRSQLLAWLDLDDCCSDACGNVAPGVAVPCHLLSSNPCTVALSTIAARTQFRWLAPTASATGDNSGLPGGWVGTISVGTLPSSWTITSDPGGANGTYTMEWTVPVTVSYAVTVNCDPFNTPGCGTTPTSQFLVFSSSITITASVANVTAINCSTLELNVSAVAASSSSIANLTCGQTNGQWSGGLTRSIPDDVGCASVIRFASANYYAFAFKVLEPNLTGHAPVCLDEAFTTLTNPLGYLEIITPLGVPTDHCP